MLSNAKLRALRAPQMLLRPLSLILFALSWELLAHRLQSLLLPGFFETIAALVRLASTSKLWQALWLSNQAMLLGFFLAAVVGVLFGLAMGRWRAADRYLDPYLTVLIATPKAALIPIVIMATGLGLLSRVLITFTFAVVVVTVNARAGMRMVDPSWTEMARSFTASEEQLWRKILIPGALPAIMTGLRLGVARATSGMVTVELLLVAVGIGRLILDFQGTYDAASLYATVLVVVAEAILLLKACHWLERKIVPWAGHEATR